MTKQWIMVFSENKKGMLLKSSLGAMQEARRLADIEKKQVAAVWCGRWDNEKENAFMDAGADEVLVFEEESFEAYRTEHFVEIIGAVLEEYEPELILFGSSHLCNDLAARASVRFDAGLITDAVEIEYQDEGSICLGRPDDYRENRMNYYTCRKGKRQMATLKLSGASGKNESIRTPAAVRKMAVSVKEEEEEKGGKARILNTLETSVEGCDITVADCLVSGGRGIRGEQGFEMLGELASLLKGEVASSRPNVDEGWIEKERQVGLSGKTVAPKLYLACGISGSTHHVVGMEGSGYVIAINVDRNAPIFDVADLGIVGDVQEILPLLVDYLKNRQKTERKTIQYMESFEKNRLKKL